MADIELVIKMDEDTYKDIKKGKVYSSMRDVPQESVLAIANGIPLPKGHGDLIDRKMLMDNGYQMEPVEMWYGIKYADTIIEADKGVEE